MSRETIRQDMIFVKEQIDTLLRTGSKDVPEALTEIADMEYVRALAEGDNELEIVELMVRIHKLEKQEGLPNTVLSKADSLEALLAIYYKVLFGLQRFWFELETEYKAEFVGYLQNRGITPYTVYLILQHSRVSEKEAVWREVTAKWESYHE